MFDRLLLLVLVLTGAGCQTTIGTACVKGEDCASGQFCAANFPAGYCSQDCTDSKICPAGSACITFNGGASAACYEVCKTSADCRTGYYCFATNDSNVCYPS